MTERRSIAVLARGPFGHAVGGYLGAVGGQDRCDVRAARSLGGRGLRRFLAGSELGVLATHRDVSVDLTAFAAAAQAAGLPWLAVALSPGQVRVGPVIIPGTPGCQACYSARAAQHGQVSAGLEQAFARDQVLGVDGFPPHVAAMAASLVLILAGPVTGRDTGPPAGTLYVIDLDTDAVSRWRMIPVDGCPECEPAARGGAAGGGPERLRAVADRIGPPPERPERTAR